MSSRTPLLVLGLGNVLLGDDGVGGAHDIHLVLTHAHGLHEHELEPGGVEQVRRVERGAAQASQGKPGLPKWP